ncbi:MAG: endonuclease V [Candidatus Heimdallarchaeota archaeon]
MVELEPSSKFSNELAKERSIQLNKKLQILLSSAVLEEDLAGSCFSRICAVDVAYKSAHESTTFASCAVITDDTGCELAAETIIRSSLRFPYISGHFSLRELPCILEVLSKVGSFDLLLLDCNGRLHPRRFGMACHAGICIAKPTIGVAKSLPNGFRVRPSPVISFLDDFNALAYPITLKGEIVGAQLPFSQNKTEQMSKSVYVSVGNLISLSTAVLIVSRLIKGRAVVPLKLAHERSIQALQDTE